MAETAPTVTEDSTEASATAPVKQEPEPVVGNGNAAVKKEAGDAAAPVKSESDTVVDENTKAKIIKQIEVLSNYMKIRHLFWYGSVVQIT